MRRIHYTLLIFSLSIAAALPASAQMDTILLNNPSFEDVPHPGTFETKGIRYWTDCGRINFPSETPPDLHSAYSRHFEHAAEPSHGDTYVGMVSRSNDTYESISQRLSTALEADQCYEFTIDLRRSNRYMSAMKEDDARLFNYNEPIILYIYGGTGVCGDQEVLAESEYVKNTDWKTYTFNFRPTKRFRYLTFEVSYKRPTMFPYNGNILVDNAGAIIQVPCPGDEVIAEVKQEEVVPPHKRRKKTPPPAPEKVEETVAEVAPPKKESILKLDRKKIVKGQVIEIKNLYFEADTSSIGEGSNDVLEELFEFLAENEDIRVEIGGHTNIKPPHKYCDELSKNRAKSVAYYLAKRGIAANRLTYKGYGKRKPKSKTYSDEAHKLNQRVEIKILSFDT